MGVLENLPYQTTILLSNNLEYQNCKQQISLTKYACSTDKNDRYYLRTSILNEDGEPFNLGYLYFYLNTKSSNSEFIGVGVNEDYRNSGIASLLISSWIQLCLNDGIDDLMTISRQRKPFLLYLLKKYDFELMDINNYQTSTRVVHICRSKASFDKCIMFPNKSEEKKFRNSNIMKTDNYEIISSPSNDIEIIDTVVLSVPYIVQDNEKAYQKSLQTYNRYRK